EPTRGLDPVGASEIMEIFYDIYNKTNKTIILITHDMNIVHKYSNRVIALTGGKISYDGSSKDLFSSSEYINYNLVKPDILKAIDVINAKFSTNIGYNNYNTKQLISSIKDVICHE
ncbi:MAG: energy-coupling factor ABC transporter ATP-binding protein, partial [Anaeroplasmataceae bacterium]